MDVELRPATLQDLPQIHRIFTYYVLNTVISFLTTAPPLSYITSRYEASISQNLPYLVAVAAGDEADDDGKKDVHKKGTVLGYACASGFRSFMIGYVHTVEMTIFVHPDCRSRGLGSRLMDALLKELKGRTHACTETEAIGMNGTNEEEEEEDQERERDREERPTREVAGEKECKQVLAVMAVDEVGEGKGLKEWYVKSGFREVGRLKGVGWKFGRELDTLYMQREI